MAVYSEIACLTCLDSIECQPDSFAALDVPIQRQKLRGLSAGNVDNIAEIAPDRSVCARTHREKPVFAVSVCNIGIAPARLVHEVFSLTEIHCRHSPILVGKQANPSRRKQHSVEPGGLSDLLFRDNRGGPSPQDGRGIERDTDAVEWKQRKYKGFKQIGALNNAEVWRRRVYAGRISLCCGSTKQIGRQQKPRRLIRCNRCCSFGIMVKMRVVVPAGARKIKNRYRLGFAVDRGIMAALQEWPFLVKEVKAHALRPAERDIIFDHSFIKLPRFQQIFDVGFAFRPQRIHQEQAEESVQTVLLQRGSRGNLPQLMRAGKRFPDTQHLFLPVRRHDRDPCTIQDAE